MVLTASRNAENRWWNFQTSEPVKITLTYTLKMKGAKGSHRNKYWTNERILKTFIQSMRPENYYYFRYKNLYVKHLSFQKYDFKFWGLFSY